MTAADRPRRGAVAVLLWLLLLAAAGWQVAHNRYAADLSAFLPATADARQRVLIDQVKSGVAARTLLVGIDGGDAGARAAASKQLGADLRASGLFEQVNNGESGGFAGIGTWLFDRRYVLSPATAPERYTAAGLRDAIAESLSLLGTPAGNAIKPLLDQDPTGEVQRIAEAMLPVQPPRTENGVWMARSGQRALLLATTRAPGADLDAQAAAIARIRVAQFPGLTVQVSGAPVFAVESRARIEAEVHWLAIGGALLATLLLLAAFASPLALLVAVLPVATGVVAGIAAVGLVFGNVHGVTLGFGATLIGEAVDYAIYYLIQARAGWRQWLAAGWPTVRMGLLTSVCGFAALLFSGFPGLQQLGVFSLAGLLAAAATTRCVLPVLMPHGARGVGLRRQLGRGARAAAAWLPRTRWVWIAAGVASAVLVWQRSDLWAAELSSLSPVSQRQLDLDASLRAELMSGDSGAIVAVAGPDAETTLVRAEAAAARLETLVDSGAIAGYDSVTRFLPSVATQRARIAALPDAPALTAALAEATQGGPLRAERLGPFVAAVQAARQQAPATVETIRGTPIAPLVDALLLHRDDGTWSALLPLSPGGKPIDTAAVRQALQGVPDSVVLEIGSELRGLYRRYLGEAQTQSLLGALGVVLLMAVWLKSPRRVAAVCLPLALAVLLTLGGLSLLRVPLNILHLVGLLLVVALGSNYALFFDWLRHTHNGDDDDTLASLLLANLTTVLSFALIALSQIPALSAIGRVVAPGALLALLLAAALLPRRA